MPASSAGDVITAIDGNDPSRPINESPVRDLLRSSPATQIQLTYTRDGQSHTVTVKLTNTTGAPRLARRYRPGP